MGYKSGHLYSILEYINIPKVFLIYLSYRADFDINLLIVHTPSHTIKNTEAVDINETHIPHNIVISMWLTISQETYKALVEHVRCNAHLQA